jgi:hypothetical protein
VFPFNACGLKALAPPDVKTPSGTEPLMARFSGHWISQTPQGIKVRRPASGLPDYLDGGVSTRMLPARLRLLLAGLGTSALVRRRATRARCVAL